jgi:outer membrane lipopolysaccharide assembly protein LptE/RlpB
MKMQIKIFLLLIALLGIAGCGYHLAGTGSSMPSHVHTIAIPVFSNSSSEPEIERELTRAVRDSFIRDGRLRVADKNRADLVMKGKLTYYNLRAVSFSTSDVATEYWVELRADIEVFDQVKNKTFLKQNLFTKWDFTSSADVATSESARLVALDEAYRELGNRVVSLVIEQF